MNPAANPGAHRSPGPATRHMAVLTPLLAATVMGLAPQPGAAECLPQIAKTLAGEVERIGDCLDWIAARPATAADPQSGRHAERLLYTWGPQVKIDRMRGDPYFCDYEFARQSEFEYHRHLALPTAERFWGGRYKLRSMSQLDAALTSNRPADAALSLTDDQLKGRSVQFALAGLRDPGVDGAERRRQIEQQALEFAGLAPSMHKARAEGRLAAIGMIDAQAAGDGTLRPSSIKGGLGVYFSTDPFRFFTPQTNDVGLVCRTPDQRVLVDRSRAAVDDFLHGHRITVRGATLALPGAEIVPTLENPALFDRAARRRFIVRLPQFLTGTAGRQSAYVDKCVLPYHDRAVCQPLTIAAEWLGCDDFRRLLGIVRNPARGMVLNRREFVPASPDLQAANTALHAFLARADGYADYAATFKARFQECYGMTWQPRYKKLLEENGRQALGEAL